MSARFFVATIALFVLSCNSQQKPAPSGPALDAEPPRSWSGKMQALSVTLSDLLPLVTSKAKFNAPANYQRIETDVRSLRTLAHGLQNTKAPNADPSMQVMSGLFEEDLERAGDSLRTGNREYARQILKDTTSYCVHCHTQTNNGPEFPHLRLNIDMSGLSKIDQAEYFAATRQFDRALAAYRETLAVDPSLAKDDPFSWEQGARAALAILVRVKYDAKETLKLVGSFEKNASIAKPFRATISNWKKTIQEWSRERQPRPTDRAKMLKEAERLLGLAQKRQEFPLDHSQDVVYFRASSLLHDFLQGQTERELSGAKAMYLAGLATEATRDMNFWTLHETFYEQCIRWVPNTAQSEKCFARLNDSVILGYSGSGGVKIPPEVSRRMEKFRAMAKPAQN